MINRWLEKINEKVGIIAPWITAALLFVPVYQQYGLLGVVLTVAAGWLAFVIVVIVWLKPLETFRIIREHGTRWPGKRRHG